MNETYVNFYPRLAFAGQQNVAESITSPVTRTEKIEKWILLQIAVVVLPGVSLLAVGKPELGGRLFFVLLAPLLVWHLFFGRAADYLTLVVGVMPAMMLFRDFFLYNSVLMSLCVGLGLWTLVAPGEVLKLWHDLRWRYLLLLGLIYWLASFYRTGTYASNFRVMELVAMVASISLLGTRRGHLATAFLGIGISAFLVGASFLPYGSDSGGWRLGAAQVTDDLFIGNPITLGLPLALIVLLAIIDRGRWLLLENHRTYRLIIGLSAAAFLLLSTSRGAWLVVVACVAVLALFDRRQRMQLLLSVGLVAALTVVVLRTGRGEDIEHFYDKSFSADNTLAQSTSGRSDQWEVFPVAFMDSPLFGFGPGSGKTVWAEYSLESGAFHSGDTIAWHSLYLQLGIETGMVGLIALLFLIIALMISAIWHWRRSGDSGIFLGLLGFLIIGLSVSAIDAGSGVFLGLAFLGAGPTQNRELFRTRNHEGCQLQILSKGLVKEHLSRMQLIDADTAGEPWREHHWLMDLPSKWDLSWLITRNDEPIGFLIASRKKEALHIHRLAVLASERRRYLGNVLMAAAAWSAMNSGSPEITLKVHGLNSGAIAFYKRLGFKEIGRNAETVQMKASSSEVFELA